MADQKRWFKVWTSIIANGKFAEMSLEDIGRWALLGAATALDGDHGCLEVPGEGKELCRLLRVGTLDEAKEVLDRILSVQFDVTVDAVFDAPSEGGKKRYGERAVTWRNWHKYQEDSTAAERMKTLRSKRRGEERRGEERREDEIRTEENKPPISPLKTKGDFELFWKGYPRKVGKGAAEKAWNKLKPDITVVLPQIEKQKKQESWLKEGGQFIPHPATWLNQKRWEDDVVVVLPPVKAKGKGNEIDHGDSKSAIGWIAPPSFRIFECQRGKVDNPIPIGKIIDELKLTKQ